jgi:hypothetical protein
MFFCFLGSGVGNADAGHLRRKIFCVSCDEYRAVYLRSRKDVRIEQFYPHPMPNVRRSQCNSRIEFDDFKWRNNLKNLIPALQRLTGQHFSPDNPANPVTRISRKLIRCCLRIIQPVDNNVGIEKRIGHRL